MESRRSEVEPRSGKVEKSGMLHVRSGVPQAVNKASHFGIGDKRESTGQKSSPAGEKWDSAVQKWREVGTRGP